MSAMAVFGGGQGSGEGVNVLHLAKETPGPRKLVSPGVVVVVVVVVVVAVVVVVVCRANHVVVAWRSRRRSTSI